MSTLNYRYEVPGARTSNRKVKVPNVVFFGPADFGKSTVIGKLYSVARGINTSRFEEELKSKLGTMKYRPDYLFPAMINSNIFATIKDGERTNSREHEVRNIELMADGMPFKLRIIDTPGHQKYPQGRLLGISLSDVGVFCLAIDKILADDFGDYLFDYMDLFRQYHCNEKVIYLLTMFDLVSYSEGSYRTACERVKKYCSWVESTSNPTAFGSEMIPFPLRERDAAAFVPVAVEFRTKSKEGVNLFALSEKTPWYEGPTLIEAIQGLLKAEG